MGKILVSIKVENYDDVLLVALGQRQAPRRVEAEALVDAGATGLYLRASLVAQLGLRPVGIRRARTMSDRVEERRVFSPVNLEVQGRAGNFEVIGVPDTLPNLVGQVPLEVLDWMLDMQGQRLIGNPEHGGEWMQEDF